MNVRKKLSYLAAFLMLSNINFSFANKGSDQGHWRDDVTYSRYNEWCDDFIEDLRDSMEVARFDYHNLRFSKAMEKIERTLNRLPKDFNLPDYSMQTYIALRRVQQVGVEFKKMGPMNQSKIQALVYFYFEGIKMIESIYNESNQYGVDFRNCSRNCRREHLESLINWQMYLLTEKMVDFCESSSSSSCSSTISAFPVGDIHLYYVSAKVLLNGVRIDLANSLTAHHNSCAIKKINRILSLMRSQDHQNSVFHFRQIVDRVNDLKEDLISRYYCH